MMVNLIKGKTLWLVFMAAIVLSLGSCGDLVSEDDDSSDTKTSTVGDPSSAVVKKAFGAGDTTCPNGGIQVDTGIDENKNGLLDANEVDTSEKVCNGAAGVAGAAGAAGQCQ
ncbi:hypothetical protein WDW89_10700 [Deltaproteobacteria bacterium TL4]